MGNRKSGDSEIATAKSPLAKPKKKERNNKKKNLSKKTLHTQINAEACAKKGSRK